MFFDDFALTVLSLKKRSKFKGTVAQDRNGDLFKGFALHLRPLLLLKVCCVRCLCLVYLGEPGGNQILGRCERNPDPKSRFLLKNPVLLKKLRRRPKKLRRRPKKLRSRPN
jgi:hypothetical protein